VAITRITKTIRLSTRIATDADPVAVPGTRLWEIDYRVREGRDEHTLNTAVVSEAAARRMVDNLLAQRPAGSAVEDVLAEVL
jgi:hypothetical protein